MVAKKILYSEEARYSMLRGIEKLYRAVEGTMGPQGRFAIIEKLGMTPTCTNDGVTVAKELTLPDCWENMGVRLFKEAASKANEVSGDGTTTATVLAYALLVESLKAIAEGHNTRDLEEGLIQARDQVLTYLDEMRWPVKTRKDIERVASIAADSPEIAGIIADALEEIGLDGVVSVEEGNSVEITLEETDGMSISAGWASMDLLNIPEEEKCLVYDPLIVVYDGVLDSAHAVANFLGMGLEEKRPVIFIAHDFSKDALTTMIMNTRLDIVGANAIQSCAIRAPLYQAKRTEMLKDIAVATGAELCSQAKGDSILNWPIECLGGCKSAEIGRSETVILGAYGSDEAVMERVSELKVEMDTNPSEYDREWVGNRLASLTGGITTIKVGAYTETAMRELKRRVEDALSATKASIHSGVVPGGGAALVWAQQSVDVTVPTTVGRGRQILCRACQAPLRSILENAGYHSAAKLYRLIETGNPAMGVDAKTGEIVDMLEAGIIDPLHTVRSSVEIACSFAVSMLKTDVAISPVAWPDENPLDVS